MTTPLATLHAVPDGEPRSLSLIEPHQFVYFEGRIWVLSFFRLELVDITNNNRFDVAYLWEAGQLFQPVRLEQHA